MFTSRYWETVNLRLITENNISMKLIFFFLLAFIFFACERNRTAEVKSAIERYDQFILSMQPDSLAACFLPDGKLGGEGQPAIVV